MPAHTARLRARSACIPPARQLATRAPPPPPPPPPRRPSPYRLVQPHAFPAAFAPFHARGWRLAAIEPRERPAHPQRAADDDAGDAPSAPGARGDLQGRRLVRAFEMGEGREGWKRVLAFVARVGEAIEEQDHHPTLLVCPLADYRPSTPSLARAAPAAPAYIVELSTHTHTPLPPYPSPAQGGERMRPGVTGKDLQLAEKAEEVWAECT